MESFNKVDIEPLDFIINKILEDDVYVNASHLVNSGFINSKKDLSDFEIENQFKRYLTILDSYNACECVFTSDGEFAKDNSNTLHFKTQGGFKKKFSQLEDNNKREKLDYKKARVELDLNEKILKEFPKTKFFARAGFFIALFLLVIELFRLFNSK